MLVASTGVLIAAMGVLGIAAPLVLLGLGRSLLSAAGLYAIGAIRVVFGLLLLWVASQSRMPRTVRIIGVVALINGLLTPLLGVERFEALLDWFSHEGLTLVRVIAAFAVALGAFLVYVAGPRRRPVVS